MWYLRKDLHQVSGPGKSFNQKSGIPVRGVCEDCDKQNFKHILDLAVLVKVETTILIKCL